MKKNSIDFESRFWCGRKKHSAWIVKTKGKNFCMKRNQLLNFSHDNISFQSNAIRKLYLYGLI